MLLMWPVKEAELGGAPHTPGETLSAINMFSAELICLGSRRWPSWLRHCATSRKVAGLIPDGIIGFFIDSIRPTTLWPWGRISV